MRRAAVIIFLLLGSVLSMNRDARSGDADISARMLCILQFRSATESAAELANQAWKMVEDLIESGGMGVPSGARELYDQADQVRDDARAALNACLANIPNTNQEDQYDAITRTVSDLREHINEPSLVKKIVDASFGAIATVHKKALSDLSETLKQFQEAKAAPPATPSAPTPSGRAVGTAPSSGLSGLPPQTGAASQSDGANLITILTHNDWGSSTFRLHFETDGRLFTTVNISTPGPGHACDPSLPANQTRCDEWHFDEASNKIVYSQKWAPEVCFATPHEGGLDTECYQVLWFQGEQFPWQKSRIKQLQSRGTLNPYRAN